ncbi:MAG: pirin family protein [Verrucomicrobiota bacterium]
MNTNKQITRADERMHTKIDWLDSRHSFSFGGHYDPERMGFGPLRVVNEDHVAPGGGFPAHPHSDMEIISIVLDGQLEHKDSLGNGRTIETGDIQYMSAGSGVVHSEFNPSDENPVHFMQIWIQPNAMGLEPRYADQPIIGEVENAWKLILSPDGRDGSMAIRQDVELRTVQLSQGASIEYETDQSGRGFWLFVIEGEVEVDSNQLATGDSIATQGFESLKMMNRLNPTAKIMLFDLPL